MYLKFLRPFGSLIGLAGIAASIGFGFANASSQNARPPPQQNSQNGLKVAVIGTGIGGSSAAYFIHKSLGEDTTIDVFEKADKVGGRMAVVEMDGEAFEAGASIVHDSNKYIKEFCDMGGFGRLDNDATSNMGIYNGNEFVFKTSGYSFIDKIKLFLRYGMGLLKLNRFTSGTLENFIKVYALQDEGRSFETVSDLLNTLGGDYFIQLTKKSARKMLLDNGVPKQIIDELATAVTRCNYGQDMGVNAFTGFVSLAGAQSSKLWAVKGGNFQVCKYALEASKADVLLETEVIEISKRMMKDNTVKYAIVTSNGGTKDLNYIYDAVVVAVPLEVRSTKVHCEACVNWPSNQDLGRYQRTVATFVKGKINHTAFGFKNEKEVPSEIFTTENPELSFRSIGKNKNVQGKDVESDGNFVYKVFSGHLLTEQELDHLFSHRSKVEVVDWLAYPFYSPPEKFVPFKLDEGVFYVNAIERMASAMEMGAVGGRNAALLAVKYLKHDREEKKHYQGKKRFEENMKGEL